MRSYRSALHHDPVCGMGIGSPFRQRGNSDGITTFGRIQRYNLASDHGGSDKLRTIGSRLAVHPPLEL